jgi:hypothetical protein
MGGRFRSESAVDFIGMRSPAERIQMHRLFDQDRKTIDANPKVDRLAMQVDLHVSGQPEHRSVPE